MPSQDFNSSHSNPSLSFYSQHSGSYDPPSMARWSPWLERLYILHAEDGKDGALTSLVTELPHDPEDQLREKEMEVTV